MGRPKKIKDDIVQKITESKTIKDDPLLVKKSLFRIDEAADYFQVTERTIKLWLDHGHLEFQMDGDIIKILFESMVRCSFRMRIFGALPNKEFLRPDEVANYFSLSLSTIYGWINEGKIDAVNIGPSNTIRIRREEVKKMIRPIYE